MREKICGIYCIENLINGKKYIGKSIDIHVRWIEHKSKLNKNNSDNKYLQYSWNKYSENNFKFYILEICLKNEISKKEMEWIKFLKTKSPNGYNLTDGGDGVLGMVVSIETREKMRKSLLGRIISEETRKKMSSSGIGRIVSLESREKFSISTAGTKKKKHSSEYFGVSISSYKYEGKKGEKIYKYYTAKISKNHKNYRIGNFKTEIEAAIAYDNYVIKNKLSRKLNFPERSK